MTPKDELMLDILDRHTRMIDVLIAESDQDSDIMFLEMARHEAAELQHMITGGLHVVCH